jgi:hypothetical protein
MAIVIIVMSLLTIDFFWQKLTRVVSQYQGT